MIHLLSKEFELIQDDKMREFTVDAITRCTEKMEEYDNGKKHNYVKKVVYYVNEFCDVVDAEDAIRDIMIVAALIHDLEYEYFIHEQLKPMALRIYLNDMMPMIGRDRFENLMYILSRQKGFKTVHAEYLPQVDSPIHTWILPMAIALTNKEMF